MNDFRSPSRRALLVASGMLTAAAAWPRPGQARQASDLDLFFQPQGYLTAALSPNGRRVALLVEVRQGDARSYAIDLVNADNPAEAPRRIGVGDLRVDALAWANDSRVLLRLRIPFTLGEVERTGSRFTAAEAVELFTRRIISYDVDSGAATVLFENLRGQLRSIFDLGTLIDPLPDDPDHVLMHALGDGGRGALYRVNVGTGTAELVELGRGETVRWHTQDGRAVVRVDVNARGTVESFYGRAPGETEWRLLTRARIFQHRDFAIVGRTDRPGVVLARARLDGEDVETVRELNLADFSFGEPLSRRDGHDVATIVTDLNGRFVAAGYYGPRMSYDFGQPALAPHHRAMNRFFGDECNVHIVGIDRTANRLLTYVDGPRDPGSWYLYDIAERRYDGVGARGGPEAGELGGTEVLSVITRDGATIQALLTAPGGQRPGPLVVLPHGGPEVADRYGWDRQAQVLAGQGWWVLQPNFRGSGGFGVAFAQAGWRRWGDRMQHDVEDAVAHAIAHRGLDANRVAIMGTSYGGYAALMGAVLRPDLYRAAIAICGVSDLEDMMRHEAREDDTPGSLIRNFWASRMGDPREDAPLLAAASPRQRAAEFACPVRLVHGVEDQIVPVRQSRIMHEALQAAGKSVQLIEQPGAGHADWSDQVERRLMEGYIDLLRRAFA